MNFKVKTAIMILKRGFPVPIDLYVDLLSEGVDVVRLEAKYAI